MSDGIFFGDEQQYPASKDSDSMIMKRALPIVILSCGAAACAAPISLGPGNLLVSYADAIHEYTTHGSLVQSIPIPYPHSTTSSLHEPADLVYDQAGFVHVRNMNRSSLRPDYLSSLDLTTGEWLHTEAFLSQNSGAARQLSQFGHYLYTERIRFDLVGRTYELIDLSVPAFTQPPGETAIGNDGILYVTQGGSPSWELARLDPITLASIGPIIELRGSNGGRINAYGFDANENGDVFVAGFSGELIKYSPQGMLLSEFDLSISGMYDVALDGAGIVAASQRNQQIFISDESLQSVAVFAVGPFDPRDQVYIEFVPIPEPTHSSFFLCVFILALRSLRFAAKDMCYPMNSITD